MAYDHRKQAHEWGYRDGRDGLPKTRNAGFSREFVKAYNQGYELGALDRDRSGTPA